MIHLYKIKNKYKYNINKFISTYYLYNYIIVKYKYYKNNFFFFLINENC